MFTRGLAATATMARGSKLLGHQVARIPIVIALGSIAAGGDKPEEICRAVGPFEGGGSVPEGLLTPKVSQQPVSVRCVYAPVARFKTSTYLACL